MLELSLKICDDQIKNETLSNFVPNNEKSRKHWKFYLHCSEIFLPTPLPDVHFIADDVKYHWHFFSTRLKHDKRYNKNLDYYLNSTLIKAVNEKNLSLKHIVLSKRLIDIDKFDVVKRKNFIDYVVELLSKQTSLEVVCLEDLQLTKVEASRILLALFKSRKSIKFLYIWRLFDHKENLIKIDSNCFQNDYNDYYLSLDFYWTEAIKNLHYLETLSLNYAYIAADSEDKIINIGRYLKKHWKLLQLFCSEEEFSNPINLENYNNIITIPDWVWTKVRKSSPKLKVQIIFFGVREYDYHKKFLTPSMPLQTIVLSTNVKLLYSKPCMLDCTLKTIYDLYHRSLVQLYLNLWNHREMLDNHLRKIFPSLPNLQVFEFTGEVQSAVTIITMCCQIKLGVCAIKKVKMHLQKSMNMRESNWMSNTTSTDCLLDNFKKDFDTMGVKFEISSYHP